MFHLGVRGQYAHRREEVLVARTTHGAKGGVRHYAGFLSTAFCLYCIASAGNEEVRVGTITGHSSRLSLQCRFTKRAHRQCQVVAQGQGRVVDHGPQVIVQSFPPRLRIEISADLHYWPPTPLGGSPAQGCPAFANCQGACTHGAQSGQVFRRQVVPVVLFIQSVVTEYPPE